MILVGALMEMRTGAILRDVADDGLFVFTSLKAPVQ